MELQACRRAAQLAAEVNASKLHIEMDSKDIVSKLQSKDRDFSVLGPLIQEVKMLLETREQWQVRGGGAVRGARGQVEKEPPDSASNRWNAAETFEFAINFFPSTAKLVDGSIENIQRDTIVKWEVDCAKIDPNGIQSMEEKAVRKLVEKIGETVLWGPEQEVSLLRYDDFKGEYVIIEDGEDIVVEIDRQEGRASLRAEFFAELVDLNIDSEVGYVPSHLAMQKADDDWASQRHIVPIIMDLTVIADGANAHAEEGNVNVVDWNAVELEEPTDLVIAPIADTEMAKLFGIPVDDRDEEERDEANTSDNDDIELSDVDEQLMKDAADDVDDAHDEELVHVYDKENPVIRVGKLWPNMDEFRLSFKTYAVRHQFHAKTFWTDRKKFYAKCRGFDGSGRRACKWYISARLQRDGSDKLPAVVQQVVNRSRGLTHLSVEKSSLWGAEVRDNKTGRRHVVNTELHDCSCLEWQATGKPCDHAILFLAGQPKINMHPYLHEYYSVAKFRAAYATPIPPLTDQEQWPEVPLEYSMCPPLTKRKAGRPKQSRFKAWFEKGGSSKKGKKDKKDAKPKRAQKGNRNRCKRRKLPSQPIVVEQSWPTKRARVSGSRRQTIVHTIETETEAVHTVETEAAIEFHEAIASSPVKKTKMISELVCAVQPKTRNAKAKKGTWRGRKR
ncbi:hypothetical protein D1007_05803 [Hordeum vulgare]|nr:hypothetical protein D1007_05803 [Hordeum vulgare]